MVLRETQRGEEFAWFSALYFLKNYFYVYQNKTREQITEDGIYRYQLL